MRVVLILLVLLGISLVLALALCTLVCPISDNLSLRILPSFPCSTSIVCFKNALSANRGECWYPRTLPKNPTATYRISGRKQFYYRHDSLCQSMFAGYNKSPRANDDLSSIQQPLIFSCLLKKCIPNQGGDRSKAR